MKLIVGLVIGLAVGVMIADSKPVMAEQIRVWTNDVSQFVSSTFN